MTHIKTRHELKKEMCIDNDISVDLLCADNEILNLRSALEQAQKKISELDEFQTKDELRSKIVKLENLVKADERAIKASDVLVQSLRSRIAELEAHTPAQQIEPARPDILEKLSYHQFERNDVTLDECLTYLRTGGWHQIHGRTERQMMLQLTALLASQSA